MRKPRITLVTLLGAVFLLAGTPAARPAEPANLFSNGDFELDADQDGVADDWRFSGDPKWVTCRLSMDAGRNGGRCQRMDCTEFAARSGWSHAMLCQVDKVAVRQNYRYTVSFWAKAEGIRDFDVKVGLQDTQGWKALGLQSSFSPTEKWERFEFQFTAALTCTQKSRFQVWFNSTGTLWIDDVRMTEGPPLFGTGERRPAAPIRPAGSKNLVPNASFECGPAGWGSQAAENFGWGTPLSTLFGEVLRGDAPHGNHFLKITLNADTQPVAFFDYFRMVRHAVQAPLAGNAGYIALERGQSYVLSAWLRADEDGTPARLAVRYFPEWTTGKPVTVGTRWQRYSFPFKAAQDACCVLVGPDLRDSGRTSCSFFIDAVQLEKAEAETDFTVREALEAGLATQRHGNVFFDGESPAAVLRAANAADADAPATVTLKVTDFWDRTVAQKDVKLTVPARGTDERTVDLVPAKRGFYRVHASLNGRELPGDLRVAIIPKCRRTDSLVGLNHAYGWPNLVRGCVDSGIFWARDWSLKWQDVEPVKGRFDFTETDRQVDRVLRLGQHVLGLLPFPSANWSSSAPDSVQVTDRYPGNRERMAWAPRDVEEFRNYVSHTVTHYRGRIQWWQVFNEPLYTDYSLPRKQGYTAADYVRLVQVFHEAAKAADANCKVLAGPGGWLSYSGVDLQQMIEAGLLKWCDALDLHVYPRMRPPETLERDLVKVEQMMDQAGGRKPIWLTEHGYYADDDLLVLPPEPAFSEPLPSERVQAEFSIRFNLILLAHGVRKIFYHSGTCPGLNRDHTEGIFFKYDDVPRKIYPAVAAFNELFSAEASFVRDVPVGEGSRALLFRDGDRLILAAWQSGDAGPVELRVKDRRITLRDIVGNPVDGPSVRLSSSPVFAVARDMEAVVFEKAVVFGTRTD